MTLSQKLRTFSIVLLSIFSAMTSRAQNRPPAHPPRPTIVGPAKWQPAAQEVSAAYWTVEPGWSTELEMRNNLVGHDLTVTPMLRVNTGQEISLAPVMIAPQHVVSLDLRNAIPADAGLLDHSGSFGSVAFHFDGLDAANLFAASLVRRGGEPIDFHFDGDDAGPTYNSGGIEGMWWLPAASSTDYLILSNPLKKKIAGTLALSSASATVRRVALSIGPGETKRIDLRDLLGSSASATVGGLSLSLPGKELISATQIVFDEVTGLGAIMKLFDREPDDLAANRVLRAPMLALREPDSSLAFPKGTVLVPRIFLRNAGSDPALVSATIDWRSQTGSGSFRLPRLTLLPGEVKVINVTDYQMAGQISPDANWGTVTLAYTGRRADLVAVAESYDEENRHGLQTPFSEALSRLWAGGMWHVDATHNTLIATGNGGSEATAAEATLFYNGGKGKYRMEKKLSPGEQLWLDLGHLIRDQVPDSDGKTLPPDTMTGSYELRDLDHATVGQLYEGKLVIDKNYGHASYGCASCCGYYAPSLDPSPFGGPPGIDNQDFIHAKEQCGGYVDDVTNAGYSWSSSNTAVATLPNRTLHTVAAGSAQGRAYIQLAATHPVPRCPTYLYNPGQPLTVCPVPTSELSSIQGRALVEIPGGQTVTRFQQTDTDIAGHIFNGDSVTEASGYAGTNGCYYAGAPFPPTSTVTGGTWYIGQNDGLAVNGTNQWGYDFDGDTATLVTTIRQHATLPCVDNVPQTMYIATSCAIPIPYYSNVQTVTISATTVSNCRGGVCDTFPY